MEDIVKIVKSLKKCCLLMTGVRKTIKNEANKKVDFLACYQVHQANDTEKQWNDNFKGKLYFSRGKINSCGLLIAFHGNINVDFGSDD